jgi:hypothetical protein
MGWNTLIKNLTVYGNQPIDSVLIAPADLAEMMNDGLIERYERKSST